MTAPAKDWATERAREIVLGWFRSHVSVDVYPFDVHIASALRKTRQEALLDAIKQLGGRYGAAAKKDIQCLIDKEARDG